MKRKLLMTIDDDACYGALPARPLLLMATTDDDDSVVTFRHPLLVRRRELL